MDSFALLPAETTPLAALILIAFSFLTSAISAAFGLGGGLLKVMAFGLLGFVLTQWLVLVAAMIVSGLLGTWVGRGLLQRFPEQAFRQIFKAVLTVPAERLLNKAIVT